MMYQLLYIFSIVWDLFVGVTLLFTATIVSLQLYRISTAPKDIPWVGIEGKRFCPKLQATFLAFVKEKDFLLEGYEKFSKHGKPFILPGLHWPEVIFPPKDIKWMASLAEDACDATHVQEDLLGLQYLSHGPDMDWVHDFSNIRRDLKDHMSEILPDVFEEIQFAFSRGLGQDPNWSRVQVLKGMKTATLSAFNRLTVGLPLCRDENYLQAVVRMVMTFALTGVVFRFFIPEPFKRLIMPILAIPYRISLRKLSGMCLPTVQKRLQQTTTEEPFNSMPRDMLQWTIERALRKYGPERIKARDIADTMVFLNIFAAITIDIALDTTLIDILTYPAETMLLQQLRREADDAVPKLRYDSLIALAAMPKMDSVVRETLRIHPSNDHGMMRRIVKPGGITTPGGVHLPEGTYVGAQVGAMQRDQAFGIDWSDYRPLRFYEDNELKPEGPTITAVHVSDKFLPFALGRHACPGRFFAVHMLKMILGFLVTTYDFEPLDERPRFASVGGINIPDENTLIGVRRRKT